MNFEGNLSPLKWAMKNLVFAAAGLKLMQELADTNAKAGKGIDKFLDSLNNLALCLNRFNQTSL